MSRSESSLPILAVLSALIFFGLAGVLFISEGPESTSRLGLLFGLLGLAVPTLLGALKASQAQQQTNGKLEDRIEAGVLRAMATRRKRDPAETVADLSD